MHSVDPLFAVAFFLFGLAFGSFLNVCIHRLPRELSVVSPGSACPKCGTPIGARDNIPVLSWLILRGRCRTCKAPISPRYALVELLTAFLFLACYFQFGLTLESLKYCVFAFLTTGLIFTDAETNLLPDKLTLPGVGVGILFSLLVPVNGILTQFLPRIASAVDVDSHSRLLSLADSLVGAAIGAAFIYVVGTLYFYARGVEGMGFGDVKFMAMIGAFLGLRPTVLTIFGASIMGAVFGLSSIPVVWIKRTRRRMARGHESGPVARKRAWESAKKVYRFYAMPFGVFLGSMAIIIVFFGNAILRWYWTLFL